MPTSQHSQTQVTYKQWTGRPPAYQPLEIQTKLDDYIRLCCDTNAVPNVAGFQAYLGICEKTWSRYRKHKEKAYVLVVARVEKILESGFLNSVIAKSPKIQAMYAMKYHGYSDRKEVNHTGQVNHAHLHAQIEQRADKALGIAEVEGPDATKR